LLISGTGMLLGLIFGYIICFIQISFELIVIPGPNLAFPINFSWNDLILIVSTLSTLSFIFSYFPVRLLMHNSRNSAAQ